MGQQEGKSCGQIFKMLMLRAEQQSPLREANSVIWAFGSQAGTDCRSFRHGPSRVLPHKRKQSEKEIHGAIENSHKPGIPKS